MKLDLIRISLNEADEPVLTFTHRERSTDLEQKLLGAFIRKVNKQGIELKLTKTYGDSEDKPLWEYEIRAKQPDELDQGPADPD
ncbi:hypothetical protein [Spirosoma fluminis]